MMNSTSFQRVSASRRIVKRIVVGAASEPVNRNASYGTVGDDDAPNTHRPSR